VAWAFEDQGWLRWRVRLRRAMLKPLMIVSKRLLASALCLCAAGAIALPADELHLRVKLEGRGPRTVILESGLGDTLDIWQTVQPLIAARCARTLSYNRAGYLGSDNSNAPRDAATIVAELRAELARQEIKPPYVLVGHSLGGLYMQYFARNYPDEVAGLVLIDSTHWQEQLAMGNQANTPYNSRTAVTLFMPWIMRREISDSTAAGKQVHSSPAATGIPTIVLSSTRGPAGETPPARALAARLQDEIAADFPAADHVRVDDSGHYIQKDHPEVVVAAARRLAGCKR
jgi:pimeloyl-ACP methyl ester carboxylesterase